MRKMLKCKSCGEEVEVPDRQVSVVCVNCAEESLAEKEFREELSDPAPPLPEFREPLHAALADPRFRKGYLHHRALQKAQGEQF